MYIYTLEDIYGIYICVCAHIRIHMILRLVDGVVNSSVAASLEGMQAHGTLQTRNVSLYSVLFYAGLHKSYYCKHGKAL